MSDDFQRGLQARLAHLIGEASQWARGSGAHPPGLVKALNEALEYCCAEIERLQRRVAEPHPGTGVKCAHCNGSGKEAQIYDEQTGWSDEKACDTCNGSGRITTVEQYLKTLPANWHEDSGLATWFPITAEEVARLRARIAELLRERDELVKLVMEMRGTLRDLRIHLHAAGRRPEECYEMSMIDDAIHRAAIDQARGEGKHQ